jgi:lipopolysaccharide biosynthesis protein
LTPTKPGIAVFFHNYYGNDRQWLRYFEAELAWPFHLFYNGVSGSYYRLLEDQSVFAAQPEVTKTATGIQYRESTNQGKDIGGKLVLLDAYLRLKGKSDYMLFLHDKVSPYHAQGTQWKKNLFRIVERQHAAAVMAAFENPAVGMVAAQSGICNEHDNEQQRNAYIDSPFIENLKKKYGIQPPGLQFVAGTVFWVRSVLFEEFFKRHPPLDVRASLETGNVTDESPTLTHAWERLLSWMVTGKGYLIKGI